MRLFNSSDEKQQLFSLTKIQAEAKSGLNSICEGTFQSSWVILFDKGYVCVPRDTRNFVFKQVFLGST